MNDTLATEESFNGSTLSTDDLLRAIDCGTSEGGPNGRHWVLDPIDGTKGYVLKLTSLKSNLLISEKM